MLIQDLRIFPRLPVILANTAYSTVFVGTPVTQAIPDGSLAISNIISGGDFIISTNSGGNSVEAFRVDTSAMQVQIGHGGFTMAFSGPIIFNETTVPAGTNAYAARDNTGDLTLNALTGKIIHLAIAGTDVVNVSGNAVAIGAAAPITAYQRGIILSAVADPSTVAIELQGYRTVDGAIANLDIYNTTNLVGQIQWIRDGAADAASYNLRTRPTGGAMTTRLNIDSAATAVATWSAVTHTGIVLSGALDVNGQTLDNTAYIQTATTTSMVLHAKRTDDPNVFYVQTAGVSPGFAATTRLTITGTEATAVATWSAITHTGIVLSGSMNIASQIVYGGAETDAIVLQGGTTNNAKGAELDLVGTSHAGSGGMYVYTPNADASARVGRLTISGNAATATATWSAVTHSGLNITSGQVLQVGGTQVVGARVVDARCDDAIAGAGAYDDTTAGVIDALRDAMITHGLIAAA